MYIEFDHALYDFQGHHTGAKLGGNEAAEQAIVDLVDGADMALYRNEGYFFDAIGDRTFVFGRLVEWDTVRSGECFFDLYATSLENLRGVSIKDVTNALLEKSRHISEKDQSIDPSIGITVRVESSAAPSPGDPGGALNSTSNFDRGIGHQPTRSSTHRSTQDSDATDRTDRHGDRDCPESVDEVSPDETTRSDLHESNSTSTGPSNDATGGPYDTTSVADTAMSAGTEESLSDDDIEFVAQFWEQYRRGTDPVQGSISIVDRMARLVDGTLSNIRFVSREDNQGDPYHFDVVGSGTADLYDVTDLSDTIRANAEDGRLTWKDLPTYEEELTELVRSHRESLLPAFEAAADKDEFTTPFETFRGRFDENQVDGVDRSRLEFYYEVWRTFVDDYWETLAAFEDVIQRRAAETLADATDPNVQLVEESEQETDRFLDRVSGLVTGQDDRNTGAEVTWDVDVTHVDDEEVQVVMHRLVEEALTDARVQLDGFPGDERREILESRAESVALETIRRLDKIRDSRAYRETHRD